ncbi:MAG: imidazolonepropionase [Chloroflexota bacterium]
MIDADFVLINVDHLVTVAPGSHPSAYGELGVIDRGALAAKGTKIVWVGPGDEMAQSVKLSPDATILNTHGRVALPGFVDPHTHPIFAGNRNRDFYSRARGTTYGEQLHTGGIMDTVRATRYADEDTLLGLAFARCDNFLQYGTTTIEAKSGYGLTLDSEMQSLRALNRLQRLHPVKIVPAFLGAHVMPSDYRGTSDQYIDVIAQDWLPKARECAQILDAWCEDAAFTVDQCRTLLERGKSLGFELTMHANELGPGGGVRLAAEFGALSVDHAVYLDEADIATLRTSGTIAVLLPGTTFFLGSDTYAPARRLLDCGVNVALGTDFNPGTSYTQNMQFILTLAVLKLGMSAEEAIAGATRTAAQAIGLGDTVGSLEAGKYCDVTTYTTGDYRDIPYSYAMNLVDTVVANGKIVWRDGRVVAPSGASP